MDVEKATNEQIYLELVKLKKMVQESLELQRDQLSMMEEIKLFEGKQAKDEDMIVAAVGKKKFNSIIEWKNAIWERCPSKKEKISPQTVSFYCDILRGPCMFESCPRNVPDRP